MDNLILSFAKGQGYNSVKHKGQWKGFEVYEPLTGGDGTAYIGLPHYILVKTGRSVTVRMTTPDEAFEVFDNFTT